MGIELTHAFGGWEDNIDIYFTEWVRMKLDSTISNPVKLIIILK
ncbi:MAG: hypothetical protein H6Q42_4185 [Deltaproteobacteria bacterium]|nr:hypothetical protein [Deltaproteobacteria bacterium]